MFDLTAPALYTPPMTNRRFYVGDPAPWFTGRTRTNPLYHFDTVGGLYSVLSFYGSGSSPHATGLFAAVTGPLRHYFEDATCAFFGVSNDPADESHEHVPHAIPGIRHFFDPELAIARLYGAISAGETSGQYQHTPFTLILDPALRVLANIPMQDIEAHNTRLAAMLEQLPSVDAHAGVPLHAPVLVIPRIFEPEFCRKLIGLYEQHGGTPSGFMRQKGGTTVGMLDPSFKKRHDFVFEPQPEFEELRAAVRQRIQRRLVPEIFKAFQYEVTRIERYIVACYDGEEGGFFNRHRDNTTAATKHRRFACTINLNAEEYEGGELRFPEFGTRSYRAPTGGAVVFSCSLLHEALPVTRGTRYAFLPFLYDDAAAKIRQDNKRFIRDETGIVRTPTATAATPD